MIKINSLNKTYNKNKQNQINVINNVNLEFDSTGFVSILGVSGSGKTTLLNTLGGLDKADNGTIVYDDLLLNKYKMNLIDEYRRNNIGYIFQNYLLLNDVSVYENLRIALETIDINNEEEQKKRIEYALKAVGLYKFRKKLAKNLSGGQMQRVSIARCLLKNSKMIIADEPTGNLDSENAIEVMNILKKISEKTLVLLVTHSRDLADFYSDRIIEISDGKVVNDNTNSNLKTLNNRNERKIYLKDMKSNEISNDLLNVSLYYDDNALNSKIKVVIKNNTLYIESDKKIQIVNDSNIELIDDNYKHLESKEITNFDYDTSWFNNEKKKPNVFKNMLLNIKNAFITFRHRGKRNKAFSRVFFIIGIVLAFVTIELSRYLIVDTSNFSNESNTYGIYSDDEYYYDTTPEYYGDINEKIIYAYNNDLINNINYDVVCNYKFTIRYNYARSESFPITTYAFDFNKVKDKDLLAGKNPSVSEVVLGKDLADFILKKVGKNYTYDFLVNKYIDKYIISGVSSVETNSIYLYEKDSSIRLINNGYYADFKLSSFMHKEYGSYIIYSGHDITNDNEILASSYIVDDLADLSINDTIIINNVTYTIVGTYIDLDETDRFFITSDKALLGYRYDFDTKKIVRDSLNNNLFNYYSNKNKSNYSIFDGRDIENANECLVSMFSPKTIGEYIDTRKIVGKYYTSNKEIDYFDITCLISDKEYNCMLLNYDYYLYNLSFDITEEGKTYFENYGYNVYTLYNFQKQISEDIRQIKLVSLPTIIIILLLVSIIYVYFSTRAKMLNDIHDIGVLRSIGTMKKRIYGKYISNIFVESTLTTLLGYILVALVYVGVTNKLVYYGFLDASSKITNPIIVYLGIIVLYLINFIFGLIPIFNLLRKTPSEINSKYDI